MSPVNAPLRDWLSRPDGMASRLRALRTQAGLSGKDLAEAAEWAPSKVSRLESGQQMPTADDVHIWVEHTQAEADAADALLRLLDEAQELRTTFRRRMQQGQADVQSDYNRLVADSELIRNFEVVWIPGLLQTAAYARRVFNEMVVLHNLPVEDVDAAVTARLQRQQLLYDTDKTFEFLVTEPVLRWRLCPLDVMRGQLDRLHTIIGQPNVRFGVIPMDVELATTPQNGFHIYGNVAVVETFIGETFHRDTEAEAYTRVWDRLWEQAAVDEAAREYIVRAIDALPRQ